MPYGYHGKILHVNLTTSEIEIEEPSEAFYRTYMGGSAFGAYYLLNNTPTGSDPLGPENTLTFALSVITGAPISGQSRMTAVAKSPLTDAVGDSQTGGFWPAEFKFSGFDAVVIQGKAEKPVYLWIHDGEVEIRDASHLWGKITGDAEDMIREELGDEKIEVLQIGPAGENLVRFAAIMNMVNRANGRTGMGAVMGSKNLKAIAVRGSMRPELADRKAVIEMARWGGKNITDMNVAGLAKYGTAEGVIGQNKQGGQVTNNWDSGFFENAEAISGETMYDTILKDRDTCYACTVRCKRVVEVTEGPFQSQGRYGGPEYETLSTFGSYCGIDNLEAIATANQLCNEYGMDTISAGATVAWAFNCYEEGLITIDDTGGLELNYGNAEAMVALTEMIGKGEGFGKLLGEGSARAAETIGKGSEDLVVAVKKQEIPAHMPQTKRSLGLIYAVNPFGADHQSSEHDPYYEKLYKYYGEHLTELGLTTPQEKYSLEDGKVEYALKTQHMFSAMDTVNICQFVMGPAWQLYGPYQTVEVINLITGWDLTLDELMRAGERRLNLLRAFNAREGLSREEDKLPKKFWKELQGGRTDGMALDPQEFERAKDAYYEMSGWDAATGNPTREKLSELELDWVADMLEA